MVPTFSPRGEAGQSLPMPDAQVQLWPVAFAPDEASRLFEELVAGIDWRQEEVLIFGQRRPVPRLVAWHGDPGASYTYSGTPHEPLRWTEPMERIRSRIFELTGRQFNSVLLNLYRGGRDGMGWHADDEPELGRDPVIASVSLGAPRRFCFRHRRDRNLKLDVTLSDGSLLLMSGATQHHWVHAVPKTSRPSGRRVNLTFRTVALR